MRKLLFSILVAATAIVACENKSPSGPSGVGGNGTGPGGVTVTQTTTSTTTTTSLPTTTSTTTTTTTVVGSVSRRYASFNAPPDVPADMTLFFQLLTQQSLLSSIVQRLPIIGNSAAAVTENVYQVTGVWVARNGTTGTVEGELGGALNPLETGGVFEGKLTARVGTCTAERDYNGPLGPQTLQWTGGRTIRDCAGHPLDFDTLTMLRSDSVPLPTTSIPTTTTTIPTTTTTTSVPTTTTTTSVPTTTSTTTTSTSTSTSTTTTSVCTFSATPNPYSAPTYGTPDGQFERVQVNTQVGCGWTLQVGTGGAWITNVEPLFGNGPTEVRFKVSCFQSPTTTTRVGTLVFSFGTLVVTQTSTSSCAIINIAK